MMLDALLGRLSSKFLFSLLCLGHPSAQEHVDVILYSCIRSSTLTEAPVHVSLYDACRCSPFLQGRYQKAFEEDPTNQENIVQLTIQQINARPLLQSFINPRTLQALERAQDAVQTVVIPVLRPRWA
jgi:hypothetical protein